MRRIALAIAALAALAGASQTLANDSGHDWATAGHDAENSRSQPSEHTINPGNASRLTLKWVAPTAGDVSATPAVVDGAVYFVNDILPRILAMRPEMIFYIVGAGATDELKRLTGAFPEACSNIQMSPGIRSSPASPPSRSWWTRSAGVCGSPRRSAYSRWQ